MEDFYTLSSRADIPVAIAKPIVPINAEKAGIPAIVEIAEGLQLTHYNPI